MSEYTQSPQNGACQTVNPQLMLLLPFIEYLLHIRLSVHHMNYLFNIHWKHQNKYYQLHFINAETGGSSGWNTSLVAAGRCRAEFQNLAVRISKSTLLGPLGKEALGQRLREVGRILSPYPLTHPVQQGNCPQDPRLGSVDPQLQEQLQGLAALIRVWPKPSGVSPYETLLTCLSVSPPTFYNEQWLC